MRTIAKTARTASLARAITLAGAAGLSLSALACSDTPTELTGLSAFQVVIAKVNGADLPPREQPLPANIGLTDERWEFTLQALDAFGNEVDYDDYVRVRVEPGAVTALEGEGVTGRNILFKDGKAAGTALVTAVYGPTRLWVEDLGYVPAEKGTKPICADGKDNDQDGFIDYPAEPGCEFADDDTEDGGSFAAGVSGAVHYALPRVSDVQGGGTETPYPFQGMQIGTDSPQKVIVTRVASDGFYVTDIADKGGYNSIFAFNFNTPAGMRVCDRLTYLGGTVNEFFGFTELSFPSYDVTFVKQDQGECEVPDPTDLNASVINDPVKMESLESGLVRVKGYHISKNFGSKLARNDKFNNVFAPDQSNCDYNGDGQIDFEDPEENSCANTCSNDAECTEWTGFSARGNYKISDGSILCTGGHCIQVQTSSVADFDPPSYRGQELEAVTGTMRNFSGGSLNWTIETRCPDDLVCPASVSEACSHEVLSSKKACVRLRTTDDPDEGTN